MKAQAPRLCDRCNVHDHGKVAVLAFPVLVYPWWAFGLGLVRIYRLCPRCATAGRPALDVLHYPKGLHG